MRSDVREAEQNPSKIDEILSRCDHPEGFIGLYLRRNPADNRPEFLKFYKSLDSQSQVLLYAKARSMVHDDGFEQECITKHCIEEQTDLFQGIIAGARNTRILFETLTAGFSHSLKLDADSDLFIAKCLVVALSIHTIEQEQLSPLISATGAHFADSRRRYYEHGAIVAGVLLKTSDFGLDSMEEAMKIAEHIPEAILRSGVQETFKNPNDVFESYRRVENDLSGLKSKWRPRYLQEAVKFIQEEKDREKIEACFRHFPDVVATATERMLRLRSTEIFRTLMDYDGCEEHKVEAVHAFLQRTFCFTIRDTLDEFFSSRLCLRSKVVLMFVFREIVENGAFEQAKELYGCIMFAFSRAEVNGLLGMCLEGFLLSGARRFEGGKLQDSGELAKILPALQNAQWQDKSHAWGKQCGDGSGSNTL